METITLENSSMGNGSVEEALRQQTAAILASLEAQREILQAIREIRIGDDAIGSALFRYQQKMAVMNGGAE